MEINAVCSAIPIF